MINAIRIGVGAEQDLGKRRYNKIIVMTDADVDGSHIRTLLLCFFYRQMYQLVASGHVFVAQPPLFRVRARKEVYYVQTEEEMKGQLLQRGLEDSSFDPRNGNLIEGEDMVQLCKTLASMEEALLALERRGISLRAHAIRMDVETNKLPVFHVFVGPNEYWFSSRQDLDSFLKKLEEETGHELVVDDDDVSDKNDESETASDSATDQIDSDDDLKESGPSLHITELHEVRTINSGLKVLLENGFDIESLLPQERTGIEEARYVLRRGEIESGMNDLRELLQAVRAAGEKGLQVTRFKGLGEMNAEELRETTLDPENRTLIQVTMEDVGAADEMFRVLMGDKVEPRREFIEKHALEVRNLDV